MNKKKILEIDKKHIWHPFTQMKDYENIDHTVIARGNGIKLFDIDGNEYFDTTSSWWTNIHGHCVKSINDAIKRQIEKLEHVNFSGFTHPCAAELVNILKIFLPQVLSKFFFSDNGSTSVEIALKLSFQYWQNKGMTRKTRFAYLENSYHGDTIGAVSVGGIDEFHKLYNPLRFRSFKVPSPDCSKCNLRKSKFTYDAKDTHCRIECFEKMERIFKKNKDEIAAVIVEPLLQAAGGMLVYPKEYLKRLRHIASDLKIILIFDEVATGFGRTGKMFAFEKAGVLPDILCLSKGLTGGYMPLALTVTTDEIYNAFYEDHFKNKTFYHGHSYTANPISCSAAVKNLKIFKKKNLPRSKVDVIEHFHKILKSFEKYSFISDIRYIGFIGAVDIVKERAGGKPYDKKERIGFKIYHNSLKRRLVLRPLGDTIYWFLPLAVRKRDIDEILKRSIAVIEETINESSL